MSVRLLTLVNEDEPNASRERQESRGGAKSRHSAREMEGRKRFWGRAAEQPGSRPWPRRDGCAQGRASAAARAAARRSTQRSWHRRASRLSQTPLPVPAGTAIPCAGLRDPAVLRDAWWEPRSALGVPLFPCLSPFLSAWVFTFKTPGSACFLASCS